MAEQGDKDLSLKGDPPLPFGPRKNTTWKNESFYSQKNVFFFSPLKKKMPWAHNLQLADWTPDGFSWLDNLTPTPPEKNRV